MDFSFVVNVTRPSARRVLQRIRQLVPRQGHHLRVWRGSAEALRQNPDYNNELDGFEVCDDVAASDMVVTLGGDGTLLSAVRLLQDKLRPLLGINSGSLGFLTDTPESDVENAFAKVLDGSYRLDSRMLLEAVHHPHEGEPVRLRGLNDVVLTHGPLARVIEVSMRVAGTDLGSTLADGVIVATPSGSTAYSLSAGGPIVSTNLRALILTPINAHTLTMRPLVVAADEGVEVQLLRAASSRVELTLDGSLGCEVRAGEKIIIRSAPEDLQMVVTHEGSFYDTLRTKLAWGQHGMKRRRGD